MEQEKDEIELEKIKHLFRGVGLEWYFLSQSFKAFFVNRVVNPETHIYERYSTEEDVKKDIENVYKGIMNLFDEYDKPIS